MKNKLFNPFLYIAGGQALGLGLLAMAATAVIGYLNNSHFNGVLDFHKPEELLHASIYVSFAEQGIILLSSVLIFYIAGLIFSKSSIRLIDVAGTLTLARWPMIVAALLGFCMHASVAKKADVTHLGLVASLGVVLCVIWMVALMYNAFTVSCNLKSGKGIAVFVVSLFIAALASNLFCKLAYNFMV